MKAYRTLKITYNSTTIELDVRIEVEKQDQKELATFKQTIDASMYKQWTGERDVYTYTYPTCNSDVFDFWDTAYTQSLTTELTFQREQDDGTFSSMTIVMTKPTYDEGNVTTSGKVYKNLRITVYEA